MKKHPTASPPMGGWLGKTWVRVLLWSCVAAVAVAIFYFSAQDGQESSAQSGSLADLILRLLVPDYDLRSSAERAQALRQLQPYLRKAAHFLEFAALGFFLRMALGSVQLRRAAGWAGVCGVLYAAADELHQFFVPSRACAWQDVLLDSCGVLTGVAVAWGLLALGRRICQHLRHRKNRIIPHHGDHRKEDTP